MKENLYKLLKDKYESNSAMGVAFNVTRQSASLWQQRGVPEHIAMLCHLSADIPYTYNPSDYGRDAKGLNLNLKKVTTNDHKPERIQREAA